MYRAVITFTDRTDDNYRYEAGDLYPREGLEVSCERIDELLSGSNSIGVSVIEEVSDDNMTEKLLNDLMGLI